MILGGCGQLKSPVTEFGHQPPVVANSPIHHPPPTTHVDVGGQSCKSPVAKEAQGARLHQIGRSAKVAWRISRNLVERGEFKERL